MNARATTSTMHRLLRAAAFAFILGTSSGALSQSIAARCQGMKDPTGCACALETGGTATDRTWARGTDKTAFEACVTDRGGKVGQKPSSIPARR